LRKLSPFPALTDVRAELPVELRLLSRISHALKDRDAWPYVNDNNVFALQTCKNRIAMAAGTVYFRCHLVRSGAAGLGTARQYSEAPMADVKVTCITKPHPESRHEHITHVGNPDAGWKWPREDVITSIDTRTNTFFVIDPRNGKRSDIGVVRPAGRAPHLRTYADGDWNDNLLSLGQCP
jgi:Protein of unknown function (DUF3892)